MILVAADLHDPLSEVGRSVWRWTVILNDSFGSRSAISLLGKKLFLIKKHAGSTRGHAGGAFHLLDTIDLNETRASGYLVPCAEVPALFCEAGT